MSETSAWVIFIAAIFTNNILLANFLVLWAVSSEVIAFMHGLAQNLVLVAI